jgi:hypothetical protein
MLPSTPTRLEKADEALRQMILRAVRQGSLGLGVGRNTKEKWNLLSHHVLARLGKPEHVTINITIRTRTEEPALRQQLNTATERMSRVSSS